MGWVGNEGVDINWDTSPVSSPVTVLSHRGEFKKDHHHHYQHRHYHPPPPPPPHHHHHLHYHHHRHYLQHDPHHFN